MMNEQGKKPTNPLPPSPAVRRLRFDLAQARPVKAPHFPTGKEPRAQR